MRTACFNTVIGEDGVIRVPEEANLSAGEAEVVVVQKDDRREEARPEARKKALWEVLVAMGASVPEKDWEKVPKDLARNLDQYLYGPETPER